MLEIGLWMYVTIDCYFWSYWIYMSDLHNETGMAQWFYAYSALIPGTSEHPYPSSCIHSVRFFSVHVQQFVFWGLWGHILGRSCCIRGLSLVGVILFALQCILSLGFITLEASECHPAHAMNDALTNRSKVAARCNALDYSGIIGMHFWCVSLDIIMTLS